MLHVNSLLKELTSMGDIGNSRFVIVQYYVILKIISSGIQCFTIIYQYYHTDCMTLQQLDYGCFKEIQNR